MQYRKEIVWLDKRYCNAGVEYLQFQGFDRKSVEHFKELFCDNFENRLHIQVNREQYDYLKLIENTNQYYWEYKFI